MDSVTIDGVNYDEHKIRVILASLNEQAGHRSQNVADFFKAFDRTQNEKTSLTKEIQYRVSRLAGTSLLEAAYIIQSLNKIDNVPGDICEYGVAHGRTSALLAQVMLGKSNKRKLWLYDSFEGLPQPHEKDVLLHDIFSRNSMAAYRGAISIPEWCVREELKSVNPSDEYFQIVKGWITPETLAAKSPEKIAFAYLDMDFYQSTYDVLKFLIDRMPRGGIAVVDDYGFFSEGVRTAVSEIGTQFAGAFAFDQPFADKFCVLTRQ